MIKFTEIFSKPLEYDPEEERVRETYSVREIFLNPRYIVSAKENLCLLQKSRGKELIEGLNREILFTEIALATPGTNVQLINVLGAPEYILEKINRTKV
tara:strand:- start:216 stop:512 length:297 start_codon:yes stop_codon:yes gene_type:complete